MGYLWRPWLCRTETIRACKPYALLRFLRFEWQIRCQPHTHTPRRPSLLLGFCLLSSLFQVHNPWYKPEIHASSSSSHHLQISVLAWLTLLCSYQEKVNLLTLQWMKCMISGKLTWSLNVINHCCRSSSWIYIYLLHG